jgi:hypothetical protein
MKIEYPEVEALLMGISRGQSSGQFVIFIVGRHSEENAVR